MKARALREETRVKAGDRRELEGAQPETRRLAVAMEQNANRRLARDSERIHGYYRDLLRQIDKTHRAPQRRPEGGGKGVQPCRRHRIGP